MRFITEFELREEFINKKYKSFRETKAAQQIGEDLCNAFDWKNPINGNNHHYILEIETFPMDKWVEFKQKVSNVLGHGSREEYELLYLIKELESFGKPSVDTITNPK